MNLLKRLFGRKPRLADLPKDERRRARIMMWAGVAGPAMKPDADGVLRVRHIHSSDSQDSPLSLPHDSVEK